MSTDDLGRPEIVMEEQVDRDARDVTAIVTLCVIAVRAMPPGTLHILRAREANVIGGP